MTDLTDTIETNAAQPQKVHADGMTVEQHSLKDQIEADKHRSAKAAARTKNLGLRFTSIVPPGPQ